MKLNQELRDEILATKSKSTDALNSGIEKIDSDSKTIDDDDRANSISVRSLISMPTLTQQSSTNQVLNDDDTDIDTSTISNVTSDNSLTAQISANNVSDNTDDEQSNVGTIVTDEDDEDLTVDDYDENDVLESFDRIIEEECKLINDTDILREEELVEFKERCIKLNDENVALRKEIDSLRVSGNKNITAIIYTAPVAILLIYYLFSIIFS